MTEKWLDGLRTVFVGQDENKSKSTHQLKNGRSNNEKKQ